MTVLVLEPHNDDAALFCAFNAIRHEATIVTVLAGVNEEPRVTAAERELESRLAAEQLGCEYEQWTHPDSGPDWAAVRTSMVAYDEHETPEVVFAPYPGEKGAHPQHVEVGTVAQAVFGERCRFYLTYRYGGDKTRGIPVDYEPGWIRLKLLALACFRSQIERGPHRFFAMDLSEHTP